MNDLIEKVETFIQRINDMEFIITKEASKLIYSNPSGPKEEKSLADSLANGIYLYEQNRNHDEKKLASARLCNVWINRAFTQGVVQEGQGLAKQLKECREENAQLERDNKVLSENYLNLKMMYEAFASQLDVYNENDLEDER